MKSEFYRHNFEPDNIELLVYTGSGKEFIQYETESFKNLRDAAGNIKPIFIASVEPLNILNNINNDKSEISIAGYTLFSGLLEIQRNLNCPIYPGKLESLICNLGCVKQKEYETSSKIFLVLPSVNSSILITTEVDYNNIDTDEINSEINSWLNSDELEIELMTFIGYDHEGLMNSLTSEPIGEVEERMNTILSEMFDKNKIKYLPAPFDEAILYWDNCIYINNHLVDFPIDFYETLIDGRYKLIELDYKIICGN